ncbi:MAG: VCBS repeat-containing protein [Roseibacillus sp.]|nr:VCBS repeat-containing protein [Roseibacillus sp.]
MSPPHPIRFLFRALSCVGVSILLLAGCGEKDEPEISPTDPGVPPIAPAPETPETALPEVPPSTPRVQDDPASDGRETEVLASEATRQLKTLGKLFFKEDRVTLKTLLAPDFTSDPLVPAGLQPVLQDHLFLVERRAAITVTSAHAPVTTGTNELTRALEEVRTLSRSGNRKDQHVHFKVVTVSPGPAGNTFQTEVITSLSFSTEKSLVEHHSTWLVHWNRDPDQNTLPTLTSLSVREFSRTTTKRNTPLYTDVTASALGDTPCYRTQLGLGLNHWLGRLPVRAMLNRFGTPGLAIGDVNGDGLDDLYLCQEPGLPNRLFLQEADGKVQEASRSWGIDWIDDSRSALFLDLDNDGDQDLVVALYGVVVIARNDNRQRFTVVTALPCSPSTAMLAAADYDRDGLLDLYICGYTRDNGGTSIGAADERFVYHDAENGAPNSLFRNKGNLTFQDVTSSTGLDQTTGDGASPHPGKTTTVMETRTSTLPTTTAATTSTATMEENLSTWHPPPAWKTAPPACQPPGETTTAMAGWISTWQTCSPRPVPGSLPRSSSRPGPTR